MITIEHCNDCHLHCETLRHIPKQYSDLAQRFKQEFIDLLSLYAVRFGVVIHTFSEWAQNNEFLKNLDINVGKFELPSGIVDNVNLSQRVGAFEIQVSHDSCVVAL